MLTEMSGMKHLQNKEVLNMFTADQEQQEIQRSFISLISFLRSFLLQKKKNTNQEKTKTCFFKWPACDKLGNTERPLMRKLAITNNEAVKLRTISISFSSNSPL